MAVAAAVAAAAERALVVGSGGGVGDSGDKRRRRREVSSGRSWRRVAGAADNLGSGDCNGQGRDVSEPLTAATCTAFISVHALDLAPRVAARRWRSARLRRAAARGGVVRDARRRDTTTTTTLSDANQLYQGPTLMHLRREGATYLPADRCQGSWGRPHRMW